MVESSRGRGRRLPGSPAAARPRLNLNSPGRRARPRAEDQQPSEASLSNKRPTAPPQIFPLSQVPTGPRQATNPREPGNNQAGRASGSTPRESARGGARARGRKRYTAGGWATPTGPQYASPAANGFPSRAGPADAGWSSRGGILSNDKGKAPADGHLPSGPPSRPSSSSFSNSAATPIPVPANPRCTLFVSSLRPYITEADLRATFSPFGTVTRVSLRSPRPSHTFAHIAYATPEEALAALEALDGHHPTLVSSPPDGVESEAGPSRGMKVSFAETPAERESRRTSAGGVGDGQLPSLGLFRVPQTPDPIQATNDVKHEPSPSPQKRRNDASTLVIGSNGADQGFSFPPRLVPPTLAFENRSIPSIGLGSYRPPDDGIRRPTYEFIYEYIPPLRSVPQKRLIENLEDQLWRDHGRMRVESWSIEPKTLAASINLRVSVPADVVDSYRQQESQRSDRVGTGIDGERADETAATLPRSVAPAIAKPPSNNLFDDAGVAHFRAALPESATGDSADAQKQRRLFLVAQIRRLNEAGDKIVLNSRIEGDEIVIDYMLAEEEEVAAEGDSVPPSRGLLLPSAAASETAPPLAAVIPEAERMQDVKPIVAGSSVPDNLSTPAAHAESGPSAAKDERVAAMDVDDDEVDQLATPPPGPDAVRFPLPLQPECRADSTETYTAVDAFLKEYFRRFDESRSTLESFYTANALLSVKIDARKPARLLTPQVAFSPQWLAVQNKVASTPVAITNTIRLLPAVSHNVDRLVFTARTIPELHVKSKTRAPILLHIVGEFEEFLEKTIRSFSRTFILVPRPSKTSGAASDGFLVHSDQLAIRHAVAGEPSRLLVQDPPFTPGRDSDPATHRQRAPPGVVTTHRQANVTEHALPPHPLLARRQALLQSPIEPRQPPAVPAASRADSSPRDANRSVDGDRTSSPETAGIAAPASPPPRQAQQTAERLAPLELSSESESSSRSSHTSVSPEVQRRQLPTSSDFTARSASALGKRSAAIEASQTQARKKRAAHSGSATGSGALAASDAIQAAPARTYTAEELRRLVQQEVAAQLARSAAPGQDQSDVIDHGDDAVAIVGEARASSGESRRKEKADADRAAAAQKASAAAAATEERKRRAKEQAKAKEKKAKAEVASAQAGPPLGTGLGTSDARILLTGGAQSLLHGFNGSSNKLRHMVDTGSSYLAVSHIGDVVEFSPSPSTLSTTIRKLHGSTSDTYRVDDFAWSDAKDTLVVGFLGIRQGKVLEQPPNQVVLYKRDAGTNGTRLIQDKVDAKPHKAGGVTALTTLPGSGRLRFVTGGEDKQMYIWSRSRSTQEYTTNEVRSNHSSMITSLTHLPERNWLVSSGKDKRLQAYDLEHLNSTWQALLHDPIMTVEPLSSDPFLVLARMSSSRDQFAAYDIRRPPTSSAVLTFGYELAPHRSVRGALASTNMGRYFRGAQCDTIYAFPDYSQGVKLWDLRNVRSAQTHLDLRRQELPDLGRSKVVQVAFRGRSEMCLMDQSHVTRVTVRS